jgi:hypothetical protein
MIDPFIDTEIGINGDLECFREEWNKPQECKCSSEYSPCASEGIHPPFNVEGTITGRTDCSGENPCATPSLAPGMSLADLGVYGTKDGELKPITEALTDEQIDKIDDELKTTVSFMYSDNLGGVTVWRPYTGEGVLLPSDISFGLTVDSYIFQVEDDRDLDKWVKDIPIRVWKRMVLNGIPFEAGDDN